MRPTWLVAKYMDDLQRREPRNVGVLLFTDHGVADRFQGQREDETIDGRSTTVAGDQLRNYKAWVAYWRDRAQQHRDDPRALLTPTTGDASYYLDFGGEQLLGEREPSSLLDELFAALVHVPTPTTTPSVRAAAERIFDDLGIRVHRKPELRHRHNGVDDVLRFDFRYDNGRPHLMKAVAPGAGSAAWNAVHQTAYLFEKMALVEALREPHGISLVQGTTAELSGPLDLLRSYGPLIDLERPGATHDVARALSL